MEDGKFAAVVTDLAAGSFGTFFEDPVWVGEQRHEDVLDALKEAEARVDLFKYVRDGLREPNRLFKRSE